MFKEFNESRGYVKDSANYLGGSFYHYDYSGNAYNFNDTIFRHGDVSASDSGTGKRLFAPFDVRTYGAYL